MMGSKPDKYSIIGVTLYIKCFCIYYLVLQCNIVWDHDCRVECEHQNHPVPIIREVSIVTKMKCPFGTCDIFPADQWLLHAHAGENEFFEDRGLLKPESNTGGHCIQS